MSNTALSIATRALRMISVIDHDDTPTGTQGAVVLQALNAIVHGWKAQAVDIGHNDWALSDDITTEIDPMHINGLTALLAVEILPEFPGGVLPPAIAAAAIAGWAGLQASYLNSSQDADMTVDTGFQNLNARRGAWDITRG